MLYVIKQTKNEKKDTFKKEITIILVSSLNVKYSLCSKKTINDNKGHLQNKYHLNSCRTTITQLQMCGLVNNIV
jgi:hypothetical protein